MRNNMDCHAYGNLEKDCNVNPTVIKRLATRATIDCNNLNAALAPARKEFKQRCNNLLSYCIGYHSADMQEKQPGVHQGKSHFLRLSPSPSVSDAKLRISKEIAI